MVLGGYMVVLVVLGLLGLGYYYVYLYVYGFFDFFVVGMCFVIVFGLVVDLCIVMSGGRYKKVLENWNRFLIFWDELVC